MKDTKVSYFFYIHLITLAEIKKTSKYLFTFSVIETFVLLSISIWQFYYMKNLFEWK